MAGVEKAESKEEVVLSLIPNDTEESTSLQKGPSVLGKLS